MTVCARRGHWRTLLSFVHTYVFQQIEDSWSNRHWFFVPFAFWHKSQNVVSFYAAPSINVPMVVCTANRSNRHRASFLFQKRWPPTIAKTHFVVDGRRAQTSENYIACNLISNRRAAHTHIHLMQSVLPDCYRFSMRKIVIIWFRCESASSEKQKEFH